MNAANPTASSRSLWKRLFEFRQHPIRILGYTTRSFWLILIPLTRDLVARHYDVASWLRGAWLSILTVVAIFGYAFIRWFTITYHIEPKCIIAKSGYFGLMESKIYYDKITAISASQSPIYRLFRAHKLYFNTNSGFRNGVDITLTIKMSDYNKLFGIIDPDTAENRSYTYRPRPSQVLIFSLIFSSSLSGILVWSTFLIQGSRIVDEQMQERIRFGLYNFTQHVEDLLSNIPPIAVAVSLMALVSWLASFIVNLMRHWSFGVARRGNKIVIKSGFITKRSHILNRNAIVCADMQQSLLMRIFSIRSVRINCNGYGRSNREMNALIPITTNREVACSMKLLMPQYPLPEITMRPGVRNIMFYLSPPLLLFFTVPIAGYGALKLFPAWSQIIRFAVLIGEVPITWLVIVKLVSGFTTGAGVKDGYLRLDYCRLYSFHTVIIPISKISKLSYYQSVPQFLKNNCNICINSSSLSSKKYIAKNFRLDDVLELFQQAGIDA